MKRTKPSYLLALMTAMTLAHPILAADVNLAEQATATASSHRGDYTPAKVNDGVVSDPSRWLAAEIDTEPWVALTFAKPVTVGMIDVFSGWKQGDALKSFDVLIEVDGVWQRHADWNVRANAKSAKRIYIDRHNVSKIRLEQLSPAAGRIREIAVYDNKEALGLQDMGVPGNEAASYKISFRQHQIAVNQIGYLTGSPEAFHGPAF